MQDRSTFDLRYVEKPKRSGNRQWRATFSLQHTPFARRVDVVVLQAAGGDGFTGVTALVIAGDVILQPDVRRTAPDAPRWTAADASTRGGETPATRQSGREEIAGRPPEGSPSRGLSALDVAADVADRGRCPGRPRRPRS